MLILLYFYVIINSGDIMENVTYLTMLYDFYSELLTDKQKEYFEQYYFNNLSLSEISENLDVSRNAVHKQLKMIEEKLNDYEQKLELYKRKQQLDIIINKINDNKIKKELEEIL
jgi:uncharacterized protein